MTSRRVYGWCATATALALAVVMHVVVDAQSPMAGLLVEPFAGPQPLGRKVGTVLQLQIWQTLRLAPPNNTHKLNFGRGIVYWDEGTPPTRDAEALARMKGIESQMVLWGHAQEFGNGIVVQAYLSVSHPSGTRTPDANLWRLALPELGATQGMISVGLPATIFEFAPIVLRPEVIPMLNTPAGMPIYEDRTFTRTIGSLGGDFRALEQGPDVARVQSGGITGWVRLPGLSANRSEVTDFSGGLLRMYRQDWSGAIDLLTRVTVTPRAPVNIRVSSYLLMAAASRHLHQQIGTADQSVALVERAERLNPYLRETIKYKCMALLAARSQPENLRKLEETVRTSGYLFPVNDPWLGKVKSIIARTHQTR